MAPAQNPGDKFQVRHRFVGLLFALAMTEVARQGVRLFEHGVSWSQAAPIGHLIFCVILIATSWVGWSNSIRNREPLIQVFDRQFVDLLIDVLLVFTYFVIVSKVELAKSGIPDDAAASVAPEALGLLIVFLMYAFWDLIADVFRSPSGKLSAFAVHVSASLFCAFVAWVLYSTLGNVRSAGSVFAADIALCGLVFLFRALKPFEVRAAQFLGWDRQVIEDSGLRSAAPGDFRTALGCFGILVVASIASLVFDA